MRKDGERRSLPVTSEQTAELVGCIDRAPTMVEMDLDLSPA